MSNKFKILIGEDDDNDFLMITTAISRLNFEIELLRASNGIELISSLCKNIVPDIIIVDINMPLKNGFDVIKELKSDEKLKIIPIIVLSTSDYDADIFLAYSLGANCYISKPNNFDKLIEIISSINDFWNERRRFCC